MDKMTVARALVELKTLTIRIDKLIQELEPVSISKGGKLDSNIRNVDEYKASVLSSYQKLMDLVKRKRKIKAAIVYSNALTKVKIGSVEMTVAEAIERKVSINSDKGIKKHLSMKLVEASKKIISHNEQMQKQLLQLLNATYSKSETEVSKDDHDKIAIPFKANNEAILIDPLDIKKKISELDEEIDMFESEVDIALTESNATTIIEL